MELRNPFSDEVRNLYLYNHRCFICGANGWNRGGMELHHILGRCSASALNSAPLCGICHRGIVHSEEEQQKLFLETIQFLKSVDYELVEEDYDFIENHFEQLYSEALDAWLNE